MNTVIIINAVGIFCMVGILWWFFFSRPRAVSAAHTVIIHVQHGVYEPSQITASSLNPIVLQFLREDPTPNAETVIFPKLHLNYALPLRQTVEIKLPPQPRGQIIFTCQTGLYKGNIIVE